MRLKLVVVDAFQPERQLNRQHNLAEYGQRGRHDHDRLRHAAAVR
jgi:hypothetical protein